MPANFRGFRLPARPKIFHEHHKMRIAHGHRNPTHLLECQLDGKSVANLWLSHPGFEYVTLAFLLEQPAQLDARSRAHGDFSFFGMLCNPVGCDAARAIT